MKLDFMVYIMDYQRQGEFVISNVKISIIFLSKTSIQEFKKTILEKNGNIVYFKKNIIVIKAEYTIIILYKPPGKNHVNLTKIKHLQNIETAISYVRERFFPPSMFHLVKHKIDNITTT